MANAYDLVVIGGGPGGYVAAIQYTEPEVPGRPSGVSEVHWAPTRKKDE